MICHGQDPNLSPARNLPLDCPKTWKQGVNRRGESNVNGELCHLVALVQQEDLTWLILAACFVECGFG
jgi:hypothetical protein